jgi:hypothetical protein
MNEQRVSKYVYNLSYEFKGGNNMVPVTRIVENGVKAIEVVNDLYAKGYTMEDIYVLAHDSDVTHKISAIANASEIGTEEEGVLQSLANVVRSRGEAIRSKLTAIGVSEPEAERLEKEMDQGHVVVISVSH